MAEVIVCHILPARDEINFVDPERQDFLSFSIEMIGGIWIPSFTGEFLEHFKKLALFRSSKKIVSNVVFEFSKMTNTHLFGALKVVSQADLELFGTVEFVEVLRNLLNSITFPR